MKTCVVGGEWLKDFIEGIASEQIRAGSSIVDIVEIGEQKYFDAEIGKTLFYQTRSEQSGVESYVKCYEEIVRVLGENGIEAEGSYAGEETGKTESGDRVRRAKNFSIKAEIGDGVKVWFENIGRSVFVNAAIVDMVYGKFAAEKVVEIGRTLRDAREEIEKAVVRLMVREKKRRMNEAAVRSMVEEAIDGRSGIEYEIEFQKIQAKLTFARGQREAKVTIRYSHIGEEGRRQIEGAIVLVDGEGETVTDQ
jgi:hypothetical protein